MHLINAGILVCVLKVCVCERVGECVIVLWCTGGGGGGSSHPRVCARPRECGRE